METSERRLSHDGHRGTAFGRLLETMPAILWLTTMLERDFIEEALTPTEVVGSLPGAQFLGTYSRVSVRWPELFEPRHVVCMPLSAGVRFVVLTHRGAAATLTTSDPTNAEPTLAPFLDELAGAAYVEGRLELVTSDGSFSTCSVDLWNCDWGPALQLPANTRLAAATSSNSVLALLYEREPSIVFLIWRSNREREDRIRVPELPDGRVSRPVSLALTGNMLLITLSTGDVYARDLIGGGIDLLPPPRVSGKLVWRSSCAWPNEGSQTIARLALRRVLDSDGLAWRPELLTTQRRAS